MFDRLLERLDKIEAAEDNSHTVEEVLDLMERIASSANGLTVLVERYGATAKPVILRTLSFLLSKEANSLGPRGEFLIFSLIGQMRCQDDESTLINCLTTLQRQLIKGNLWKPASKPPFVLYTFLLFCLGKSVLVQHGAITVLADLGMQGVLTEAFDESQLTSLRSTITKLSTLNNDFLDSDIKGLPTILFDSSKK